jgi:hypothetical protein
MPIDPASVPQPAIAALERAIQQQAARSTFATTKLRGADVSTLERSAPHRVAYLPLGRIGLGSNLREMTEPGGWRFLLHEGAKEAIAAARLEEVDNEFVLAELGEGPFVTGTETAIRFAEEIDAVRSGRFEPVLLVASEVSVVALWLVDLDGNNDIVIMIPTSPASPPMLPMTSGAFLDRLRGLVEKTSH